MRASVCVHNNNFVCHCTVTYATPQGAEVAERTFAEVMFQIGLHISRVNNFVKLQQRSISHHGMQNKKPYISAFPNQKF